MSFIYKLVGLVCLFSVFLLTACEQSSQQVAAPEWPTKPLLEWREQHAPRAQVKVPAGIAPEDFALANFQTPQIGSRPLLRWWLPGGAIEQDVAQQDITDIGKQGFGGIEFRVSTEFLPSRLAKEARTAIAQYDSPSYYQQLQLLVDSAKQSSLSVYLQAGAGKGLGGRHIQSADAPLIFLDSANGDEATGRQAKNWETAVAGYPVDGSRRLNPLSNERVSAHLDYLFGARVAEVFNFNRVDGITLFLDGFDGNNLDENLAADGAGLANRDSAHRLTGAMSLGVLSAANTWADARAIDAIIALPDEKLDMLALAGMAGMVSNELCSSCDQTLRQRMLSSVAALHARPISRAVVPLAVGDFSPAQTLERATALFMAGANQFVLSGLAHNDALHGADWRPEGAVTNTAYTEDDYAAYQPSITDYLARLQQLGQLGEPEIDVLIYYPWLGWPESSTESAQWMAEQQPILQALESAGLRWAWVNDRDLRAAEISPLGLKVYAQVVKSVLFLNSPFIEAETVAQLNKLKLGGAAFWRFGEKPQLLPAKAQSNDKVQEFFDEDSVSELQGADELLAWAAASVGGMAFRLDETEAGLQHMSRRFDNGAVHFFYNRMQQDIHLRFRLSGTIVHRLNLSDGSLQSLEAVRDQYRVTVAPGELVPVLVQNYGGALSQDVVSAIQPEFQPVAPLQAIEGSSTQYEFKLEKPKDAEFHRFQIQAQGLHGVMAVTVNGEPCQELIMAPFQTEMGACIVEGKNDIVATLIGQGAKVDVIWVSAF